MNTTFVELLRRLTAVLGEFSEPQHVGSMRWDGTAYTAAVQRKFDPFAAKWQATLTVIADMLERQDTALSSRQQAYLDRLLFGGMGSLNDFMLDERRIGKEADKVNQELNRLRTALFEEFRHIATS